MMIENQITSTPILPRRSIGGSCSSLRRQSLIRRVTAIRDEERNDDDAERSSLVASERAMATSTPLGSPRRSRDTMSSSPQREHFQGCLKLYAENKINKDNAWNLQLIDFMSSMLRRHDENMENLQTASTVIDASTRIYSYRVDAVHYDVLKMAGGLSRAAQTKRGKKDNENELQDDGQSGSETVAHKKKKKRTKCAIAADPEVLNGDFETNDCVDPFFERLAATAGDVTSSNKAFNATLPIRDKTLALILRTDEPFMASFKENILADIDLSDKIQIPSKLFPEFRSGEHICEPFAGFSTCNWNPETEEMDRITNWVEENRLNASLQALAFDVDAEVEPIVRDNMQNDLYREDALGGLDSDEEADVALAGVVACVRGPAAPVALADMRPRDISHARLEYSYCALSAWAGPAHWRLRTNRASKLSEGTQSTAGRTTVEGKKPPRTKKQLDFLGIGLAFDCRAEPVGDYEPTNPARIMISRKTLATGHTWNEGNFKTPIDRGLDESHFRKLFVRRRVWLTRADPARGAAAADAPLALDAPREYDYGNENDASYCPTQPQEADEWDAEEGADVQAAADVQSTEGIGDLLEPPIKVPKIYIPYAMRAKRVDMKQLKHATWSMLTGNPDDDDDDEEEVEVARTTFFSVYSRLPSKLSSDMCECLSVPLALLSVLHLANEKGLILEKKDDLKDIDVIGLIK